MSDVTCPANAPALPDYPAHVLADDNYAWRERAWRRPPVEAGEVVVFEEPGRVFAGADGRPGVCCRSHYFVVVQSPYGGCPTLRVRHGGGDRSYPLSSDRRLLEGLAAVDSDQRFRLLWTIMQAYQDGLHQGSASTAKRYEDAFVEGRLKRRKVRGASAYRVFIRPAMA